MNRLHHVSRTLPVNMRENQSDLIQFVLLDYNSTDGLEEYIKVTFAKEIANGKLIYYKNNRAAHFNRSHSKNMAFRLADGEILCNLDADNYAGPGFGVYILNLFSSRKKLCLTGLRNKYNISDAIGKLCVRKKDFLNVTGFDESFEGHGFEDYDIVNRLYLNGLRPFTLNQSCFLQVISHDDIERYQHEKIFLNLHSVYVHYIDFSKTDLLFLFTDNSFKSGTITNNYTLCSHEEFAFTRPDYTSYQFELANDEWEEGHWTIAKNHLTLSGNGKKVSYKKQSMKRQDLLQNSEEIYYRVNSNSMVSEAIAFFIQLSNRIKMLKNLESGNVKVNPSFGNGIVYRNFKKKMLIKN